jgi:hypothetical protein
MSIFKRNDPAETQQAVDTAVAEPGAQGKSEQQAKLMPPFVTTGVVPPAAAPMYSMRPPESGAAERDTGSLIAERVRTGRGTQENVQDRLRIALQRTRMASSQAKAGRGRPQAPVGTRTMQSPTHVSFDPVRAAQTGLLNLAWSWQEAGAPIRAINAYLQVLLRYPDTPAAAAAVADLVELSDKLAGAGQFHTALVIYDHLEQLA